MKKTKLLAVILAMETFLFGGIGCTNNPSSSTTDKPFVNTYDVLKLNEIPVSMWVTLPEKYRDDLHFSQMAESGINVITGFEYNETDIPAIKQSLNLADKYGMKFLVADPQISIYITKYLSEKNKKYINDAMNRIEEYVDSPAYAGQLFLDEPSRKIFAEMNDFIQAYKENYAGFRWHINMFPCYAEGGCGVPYEQYVDDWLEMVKPDYYSFDYYPLLEYDESDYFAKPERENYYYNLDLLRSKTSALKIPFWSFIQTLGFSNTTAEGHREPSEADIRWQVFTNLAFGAKGIQYFCYFTPGSGRETFYPALIDADGNKTVRYDYVKKLNDDIRDVGKILLRCDAEGMILSGKKTSAARYKLYEEALTSYGNVIGYSGEFVGGCLKDGKTGDKYLLITTLTPRDSASVTLELKSGVKNVTVIEKDGNTVLVAENGKVSINVKAGDGVLIKL